jgi:AcrR family transcriptional regulator
MEETGALQPDSEARERVLVVAERLFRERGYQNVTLRDIAQEIGIRHTSLYHHFPHGKEELFVDVTTRRMQVYRTGLQHAIEEAGDDWQERLRAAANWLLAQPEMRLARMMQADMPRLSAEAAEKLRVVVFSSLLSPLGAVFAQALAENPRSGQRCAALAGMFLSLIEGIDNLPATYLTTSRAELVEMVLDLLAHGLRT